MPAERRGQAIAFEIGSTGDGRNPMFNGRWQPSCGGTSRMTRECQVRICERLGVQFPGPTRQFPGPTRPSLHIALRNVPPEFSCALSRVEAFGSAVHLMGGAMKETPKCLKRRALAVTTVSPWTAVVAAMAASSKFGVQQSTTWPAPQTVPVLGVVHAHALSRCWRTAILEPGTARN